MKKEVASARLFLFLALFSIITMLLVPEFVGSGTKRTEISPRMWPYFSLGLLLLFSIGGFFVFVRKHSLSYGQILDQSFWRNHLKQIYVMGFVIVYILSMEYLGYIVSSFIALTALFYIFGARQRHVFNLLLSAGFVLATYYLFVEIFKVSLPLFALI